MYESPKFSDAVKAKAAGLGFAGCGFASLQPCERDARALQSWLDNGFHGAMGFMARHAQVRSDPSLIFDGARSAVVVAMNYRAAKMQPCDAPQIAQYAYGADYHYIIKEKLKLLSAYLLSERPGCRTLESVDTLPLPEKMLAARAGLGWIGKNTLLNHPAHGSFVFVGVIATDLEFAPPAPHENRCGNCTRCIDACPTGAIAAPYIIDARRCIAYHTIEDRGDIPPDVAALMGNRLFGCDACQTACPWNATPVYATEKAFDMLPGLDRMTALEWKDISPGEFRRRFAHSPLRRAGLKKIRKTLEVIEAHLQNDLEQYRRLP